MKNYLSVLILILVIISVFALSNFYKPSSLNVTTATPNTTEEPENFVHTAPRYNTNQNINFENNFGGTETEEYFTTYKFDNYYTIAKTNSTNRYLQHAKNNNLSIFLTDNTGYVLSVYLLEFESDFEIIDSKIFDGEIYILVNCPNAKLVSFNLNTNQFCIKSNLNHPASKLLLATEPIIVLPQSNKTSFYFVKSQSQINYDKQITSISFSSSYLNGVLLICNLNSDAEILFLDTTSVQVYLHLSNTYVLASNFNINFNLIIKSNNLTYILGVDTNFNQAFKSSVANGNNYKIEIINGFTLVTFINLNNTISAILFCKHGDTIFFNSYTNYTINYNLIVEDNTFTLILKSNQNQLLFSNQNLMLTQTDFKSISTSSDLNVLDVFVNNNSFTLFGNFEYSNALITQNFGSTDIFVCNIVA